MGDGKLSNSRKSSLKALHATKTFSVQPDQHNIEIIIVGKCRNDVGSGRALLESINC